MMKLKMFTGLCKIIDIDNKGHKIEPCGMPVVIGNMFDFILSISLYCLRLFIIL